MKSSKFLVGIAAVATLIIGSLMGPAIAHTRYIDHIYTANWGEGGIHVQAWLKPMEKHAGTMKITLKKKNASGDWVFVDRQTAEYAVGWGYAYTFDQVPGTKVCKAIATFKSDNHPDLKKAKSGFGC